MELRINCVQINRSRPVIGMQRRPEFLIDSHTEIRMIFSYYFTLIIIKYSISRIIHRMERMFTCCFTKSENPTCLLSHIVEVKGKESPVNIVSMVCVTPDNHRPCANRGSQQKNSSQQIIPRVFWRKCVSHNVHIC